MVIAAFFVMPTVSALVGKTYWMHSGLRIVCLGATLLGVTPIDWFTDAPLFAVILIVGLGMAALCDPHPAHGAAVPGRGARRKRRDGRRERAVEFIYLTLRTSRPITVVIPD